MVKKEEDNSATGYEDGQYLFVLYNQAFLQHKTNDEITHFRLLVRSQWLAKQSDHQESRHKQITSFNDFIIGVKSYMEV